MLKPRSSSVKCKELGACLSTVDNTVAVGGVLFKEVELPVEGQWGWTEPMVASRWTPIVLHVLHSQGLDDGVTEVQRGEWLDYYLPVEDVAVHCSTLMEVENSFLHHLSVFPMEEW